MKHTASTRIVRELPNLSSEADAVSERPRIEGGPSAGDWFPLSSSKGFDFTCLTDGCERLFGHADDHDDRGNH